MDDPDLELLICVVDGRRIGLAVADILEILPVVPLWRPPTLPRPLLGYVTVRGAAVAVLAPALLFDGAASVDAVGLYAHLVRVRPDLCLLVDRAERMVTIAAADLRAVAAEASFGGVVTGLAPVAEGAAHVIALDRLLTESEALRIAALTADAARRANEWAVP